MFPVSTAQAAVLSTGRYAPRVRVAVKDNGGTYRYLTGDLGGWDFVESVHYEQNIDDPTLTFDIELKREVYQWSLAPLVQGSPANLTTWLTPGSGYSPLIDAGRKLKVEAAIVPFGAQPAASDWFLCFEGYIDTVDPGDGWNVHIQGRDLSARAQDTFIENERVYGLATSSGKGPFIWSASTTFAVGDQVFPTNLNGFFYQVTSITTGVTGTTEPTWPSSGTVVDGGVTWIEQGTAVYPGTGVAVETIMQEILTDNGLSDTLSTPVSPAWLVVCFKQQRQAVLEGVRALAQQIGWDVRYLYNSGAGVLTFYQPLRTSPPVQYTFPKSQVLGVKKCALDIAGIRNVVRVIYSNSSILDANGVPTRAIVQVQDNTSIARWGRRFMEIAEDATSKIDTSGEATTMANACLNDLSSPLADYEAEVIYFPFTELGDYYTFKADALRFDVDESFGVVKVAHDLSADKQRTTLTMRGKPCSGYRSWHDISAAPNYYVPNGLLSSHGLKPFDGGATLVIGNSVAGTSIGANFNKTKESDWWGNEFHLSTTPGFTPGPATLVAAGSMQSQVFGGLDPTQVYYATMVPLKRNGSKLIRGSPLPIQSFSPLTLRPQHLLIDTSWVDQPPNADFGSFLNGSGFPPDQWTMNGGTWNTDLAQDTTTVFDGFCSLNSHTLLGATLQSNYFPMKGSTDFFLEYVERNDDGLGVMNLLVNFYSAKGTLLGNSGSIQFTAPAANTWVRRAARITPAAGTRYAIIFPQWRPSAAGKNVWCGYCRVSEVKTPQPWIVVGSGGTAPAFAANWANFGGGYEGAQFFKDLNGIVHMVGFVKATAAQVANSAMFILPAGYRPLLALNFAARWIATGGTVNQVGSFFVNNNGQVDITQALALNDVISIGADFLAEQ